MADSSPSRGPGRETRLLLLTLLVSVAVLFLLARFRFPERPLTDLSPPQPFSRLTRGGALDELSGSLTELLRRAEASVVVLRVATGAPGAPGGPGAVRLVPALRVRDDLVLAPLAPTDRPIGIGDGRAGAAAVAADAGSLPEAPENAAGGAAASGAARDTTGAADASPAAAGTGAGSMTGSGTGAGTLPANAVIARDELRGLAMVRVPPRAAPPLPLPQQNEPLEVPGFVAVIEASPGGPIVRAEFISSLARAARQGWDVPALLAGGLTRAQPGALLFALNGRFIGIVLDEASGAAVVAPGDAVMAQVDRLARGESLRLARPGFDVQPLSAALARATGAPAGVVVNAIAAPGPDGPPLSLGDVITSADDQPVRSPTDWQRALLRAATRLSAPAAPAASGGGGRATMKLGIVRFGQTLQLVLPLAASEARAGNAAAAAAGAGAATASAASRASGASGASDVSATSGPPAAATLGATFRAAPGGTLDIVSVTSAGAVARAGLRPGDRVTALLPARGPLTAARLSAAFAALKSRDALVLAVDRPDGAAIVPVDRP